MNPRAGAPRRAESDDPANGRKLKAVHETESPGDGAKAMPPDHMNSRTHQNEIFAESVGPWSSYKAPRRIHHRTDKLSQEGRDLLTQGFCENATYKTIQDRIAARTGEDLSLRIIERAGVVWRGARRRGPAKEKMTSGVLGNLCWRSDEFVELAGAVETSVGAYLRRRNRIYQALRVFLKNPNCTTMRCLERELVLFAVEFRISGQGGNE
jgi:hypothetical protein